MVRIRLHIPAVAALLALAATGAAASGTHAGGHDAAADSAIGKPGVAGKSVRTIQVDMTDNMRFTPSDIRVKQGETVRFVVRNVGVLKHELVLGTGKDLRAHYEAMMKNPEMEHADPNMRFTPSDIRVKQGETVRFVVRNVGVLKHELVLGTGKDLRAHYEAMMKNPEMEHADPNMVTLAPGKTGEVLWQFTQAGKVDFGCLQPGHYDAGMKGAVSVAKAGR